MKFDRLTDDQKLKVTNYFDGLTDIRGSEPTYDELSQEWDSLDEDEQGEILGESGTDEEINEDEEDD